jgi:hypothetical protein
MKDRTQHWKGDETRRHTRIYPRHAPLVHSVMTQPLVLQPLGPFPLTPTLLPHRLLLKSWRCGSGRKRMPGTSRPNELAFSSPISIKSIRLSSSIYASLFSTGSYPTPAYPGPSLCRH